jgi:hypothetical protein
MFNRRNNMVLSGTVEIDVIPSEKGGNWWKMVGNVKFGELDFESYKEDGDVECAILVETIHDDEDILDDDTRIYGRFDDPKMGILTKGTGEKVLVIEVGAIEGRVFKLICPST